MMSRYCTPSLDILSHLEVVGGCLLLLVAAHGGHPRHQQAGSQHGAGELLHPHYLGSRVDV